jgi:dienelactone hydrolase
MPVMVWGEGGCAANGTMNSGLLLAVAAKGVLVIASGAPGGSGQTNADMLVQGINWAVAENTRDGSKYQGKIDSAKVSAQGFSCGGLEAIGVAARDRRVGSTILWSSGIFPSGSMGGVSKSALNQLRTPTAWLHGGPSDIAYQNALDDYAKVPSAVPAVLGQYGNVGHGGMLGRTAEISTVIKAWLDATLYADATAKAQFVGPNCGLCRGTQWTMQSKNW